MKIKYSFLSFALLSSCLISCEEKQTEKPTNQKEQVETTTETKEEVDPEPVIDLKDKTPISEPLVTHIYTADPSAHVFNGKLYIYPSHDIISGVPTDNAGNHFDMKDYHVFSMEKVGDTVVDHGVALDIKDIKWAKRQLWAPDAAKKGDNYYLFFPAKDQNDVFHIGVAVGKSPEGPFTAEAKPIKGSFSIDPSVYKDGDDYYLYFGGIWGGQLERWQTGAYVADGKEPADNEPALGPKVVKLSDNLLEFAEEVKEVAILDKEGNPLLAGDHDRRFFEAAWIHKYNDKYYLSYSTGDTHFIAYATGDNPYGPFTYQGNILNPVIGWTNHHSITEVNGQWYLFYHDSKLSGETHLRNIKMTPLTHNEDGTIETIEAYK